MAKPLGRPKAMDAMAVDNHVRPGERNPIEGKFGQAKTAYGMNRIKARLSETSQSWIASIVLVLNLIKLIGQAPLCLLLDYFKQIENNLLNYTAAQLPKNWLSATYSADPKYGIISVTITHQNSLK